VGALYASRERETKQLSGRYCRSSVVFRSVAEYGGQNEACSVRDALQNQSKGGCEMASHSKLFEFSSWTRDRWIHERQRSESCSGRPGPDPGILGVFPESPGTTPSVQICWLDSVHCPANVH